jgi:hypothetical protein
VNITNINWYTLHEVLTSRETKQVGDFSVQNESDQIHIHYKRGIFMHTFVIKPALVHLFHKVHRHYKKIKCRIDPSKILTRTNGHQTEIQIEGWKYIFFAYLEKLYCSHCGCNLIPRMICLKHPSFPGFYCWNCRDVLLVDHNLPFMYSPKDAMQNPTPPQVIKSAEVINL